ncbi:hypothetical protein ABGB07_36450 [Micromonosporaceae bacterium B7E4]
MPVIVREVLAEHGEQVSLVIDQNPVQAFPPYRAYPAPRVNAFARGASLF